MYNESFVRVYLQELESTLKRVSREDIARVINLLYEAWSEGRQVFLAGNGGSASTATHFACDLAKFTSVDGKKTVSGHSVE